MVWSADHPKEPMPEQQERPLRVVPSAVGNMSAQRARRFLRRLRTHSFVTFVFMEETCEMFHTLDMTVEHIAQVRRMLDTAESTLKDQDAS